MKQQSKSLAGIFQLMLNWAAISFSVGVFVLFFCLRRWVDYKEQSNPLSSHKLLVWTLIILIILVGYFIASLITKRLQSSAPKLQKFCIGLLPITVAALSLFWVVAAAVYGRNVETSMGERFIIGPYPTKEKVDSLEEEGYTAVVSLLSNAVVPFEPVLLKQEQAWCKESGLPLIHAPMLPWISENARTHDILDSLVRKTKGKYYVHCYLGRDRVGRVRRWLEEMLPGKVILHGIAQRKFEEIGRLERGPVWKLNKESYFIPFPTDEETAGFIANSNFATVVNLLDTTITENRSRLEHQEKMLEHSGIQVVRFPIAPELRGAALRSKIEALQKFKSPFVVIVWNTETPGSQAFLEEWNKRSAEQAQKLQ